MLVLFATLLALTANLLLGRTHRGRVERSWRALSPAVPDIKAIEGGSYREDATEEVSTLAPQARRSLELSASSRAAQRLQTGSAVALGPLSALTFGYWNIPVLGPWSAFVGLAWGFLLARGLLKDDRRNMLAVALPLLLMAPFNLWGALAGCVLYGGARLVLDRKDAASHDEAERERLADPRYLAGSTELRAATVARSRGGGSGEVTDGSARDNSTVT